MSGKDEEDELVRIFEASLCLSSDLDEKNIFERGIIPSSLTDLQCPFVWKYDFTTDHRDIVDRIEDKLVEMEDDDEEIVPFKMYVLNLILCYEYAKSGELQEAEEKQILCDMILDGQCNGKDTSCSVVMGCGLRHISLACKCFLLYASQWHSEVKNTLDTIVPFENMQSRDKASILCVKGAYCAEFGYTGIKESVAIIEKAVLMDGECAEWSFLLGRSLGRLRRLEKRSEIPDKQELSALESAVNMSHNASYMVLLAQTYRETARNVRIEKKRELGTFKPFIDSLNQKALELYRKVLQEQKGSVRVLIRCALGFMKLPNPWRDLVDAKRCILEALEKAPKNPMANHVAGTYYSSVKDYKQAVKYFSQAAAEGVFGADIDLILLKRKINESYNPVADLERLIHVYKEKPHQETALCYLGSYYYNIEKDFKKALEYWVQVLEIDINSEKLKVHYDGITNQGAVNINKVIITEIMKMLDNGDVSELERQSYDRIISKYIEHHPGLIVSVTDIDVSKFRNKAFKHKSWRVGGFSENRLLTRKPGPSNISRDKAPCGKGSHNSVFSSSRTPEENEAFKGPSCSNASVSTCRVRPRGHQTALSSNRAPVESKVYKDPACNVSVSTSRARPKVHYSSLSSNRAPLESKAYKDPSCSNVFVFRATSRGTPRGPHSRYPEEQSCSESLKHNTGAIRKGTNARDTETATTSCRSNNTE